MFFLKKDEIDDSISNEDDNENSIDYHSELENALKYVVLKSVKKH